MPLIPLLLVGAILAGVAMTRRPAATVPVPPSPVPPIGPPPVTPPPAPPPPAPPATSQLDQLLERYQYVTLQYRLDRSVLRADEVSTLGTQLGGLGRTAEAEALHKIAAELAAARPAVGWYGWRRPY